MKRRQFIKGSMAASAIAAVGLKTLDASGAERNSTNQEYYELRAYRWKNGANHAPLQDYLEKAAIPALNRSGARPIGVFTQQERSGSVSGSEIRETNTLFVLIPYPSFESFATATARLAADEEHNKVGAEYLRLPKDAPGFDRID